ncbi:HAD-IB family hydrolase [Comamonas piscis]
MKTVAAFDFDGTLTYRDTLFPFLVKHIGLVRFVCAVCLASPYLLLYAIGRISNETAKQRLIYFALRGENSASMRKDAVKWVKTLHVRPEMLERVKWHRSNGHLCVLISASVDVYVEAAACHLEFDSVACTGLSVDHDGLLTGLFSTPNCWGDQKVQRLQKIVGPLEQVILYAYGDSAGDLAMLSAAKYAWMKGEPISPSR